MKLISYQLNGRESFGLVNGNNGVVDLKKRLPENITRLKTVLETNTLNMLRSFANEPADYRPDDVTLLPPIPNPDKHICIGVNYPSRNEEYKDKSNTPEKPSVFLRTRESFVGHGQSLLIPPESTQLDYEGEIVLVIGKTGRRIPEVDALGYIAGLSVMNEGTVRDWVRHGKFNVTQGKNFTSSGAWGPYLVTADEVDITKPLNVKTYVNNELRQDDTSDRLMFSFRYLISYLSTFFTLQPGDIIATGTPVGSGARLTPPVFLKPGDRVKIDVDRVGILENPVSNEFDQN